MPATAVATLLKPRLWSFKNRRFARDGNAGTLRLMLFGLVGLAFWGGIFAVSLRVLNYFKNIDEIGDILALKLLSMILIIAFALLLFSSILTALSKLYLSKDLFLVHALPVPAYRIFVARWIESTADSAWMVLLYTLPVFIAYGIAYQVGGFYYCLVALVLPALTVIAASGSALLVMAAVVIIPANRMRSLFMLMGILFFVVIYLAVRLIKPELLVDPEVFDNVLVYITVLQTPSSPLLPSTWGFDALKAALHGDLAGGLLNTALAWSFAGFTLFTTVLLADRLYYPGFSKTQNAAVRLFKSRADSSRLLAFLPRKVKAYAVKEIKTFFRDQTQWSQLFLIGTLIVIYIYNFDALPLEKAPIETVYLQNLLAFLNMGLAAFVLTALTGRFAYPAVSSEKEAFWIVRSSPLPLKTFLWVKFFVYYLPLVLLSEVLIVVTNLLLKVTPFMMALSVVTVFLMVPGIVAIGIGLGAAYPDFRAENPTQAVTSFGGLLFMMLCAAFIAAVIMLESGPVYTLFMAQVRGRLLTPGDWLWIVVSFGLVFVLSLLAFFLPLHFGARRLARALV